MARSTVPKFGNWEHEDSVPYTVYFDKARKKKGEKMINPNDPQQNPHMFPNTPRVEESIRRAPVRPTTPEHTEARSNESTGRRTYNNNYNYNNQVPSRLRPVRGDETADKSSTAAVPKFGAWNDSDFQSGDNFTHIFDQVRDQRNTGGTGNPSATPKHRSYDNRSQHSKDLKKCCFPWW